MHEWSVASEIYRRCRSRLQEADSRIQRVSVAVGELSAIEPDLLRYAWEAVTSGGPDQGAALEIEWREASQVCGSCNATPRRTALEWHRECPDCGGTLHIEGGRELEVIEFAYAKPREASLCRT